MSLLLLLLIFCTKHEGTHLVCHAVLTAQHCITVLYPACLKMESLLVKFEFAAYAMSANIRGPKIDLMCTTASVIYFEMRG